MNTAGDLSLVHTVGRTVFTGDPAHSGHTGIDGGVFIQNGALSSVEVAAGAAFAHQIAQVRPMPQVVVRAAPAPSARTATLGAAALGLAGLRRRPRANPAKT